MDTLLHINAVCRGGKPANWGIPMLFECQITKQKMSNNKKEEEEEEGEADLAW